MVLGFDLCIKAVLQRLHWPHVCDPRETSAGSAVIRDHSGDITGKMRSWKRLAARYLWATVLERLEFVYRCDSRIRHP